MTQPLIPGQPVAAPAQTPQGGPAQSGVNLEQQILDVLARSSMAKLVRQAAGYRCGIETVAVTASTVSATHTVPHGLGKVPRSVQLTLQGTAGFGAAQGVNLVADPDATNIAFQVDFSVATSGTFKVYWEVRG